MSPLLLCRVCKHIQLYKFLSGHVLLAQHMVCHHIHPPHQQPPVHDFCIQPDNRLHNPLCRGSEPPQIHRAVGHFRNGFAVVIPLQSTLIALRNARMVVAHSQYHLICFKALAHQIQYQLLRHFPDNQLSLFKGIGARQHLSLAQAVCRRPVSLDVLEPAGLPAPGMVDQQLRIDPEHLVELFFVVFRRSCHIPHGIQTGGLQLPGDTLSHTPEIRNGPVGPKLPPVSHFIQLCNPDPVFIRRHMLCHNIHCDLRQVQVGADACRCGNAGFPQHIPDHPHGKLPGSTAVGFQIACRINEHLVNGVYMNILRRNIAHVKMKDFRGNLHIFCHPGRSGNKGQLQSRIRMQLLCKKGLSPKCPRPPQPGTVDLLHLLHHFKQPGSAGNAVCLQRRRNRQAYCFLRAAFVRHHQVGA